MELKISAYPSSYLIARLSAGEQIITDKGSLLYCEGEYELENIIEAGSYKNWVAKIFGGKSLTYNKYTAKGTILLVLAPKGNAEIFSIDIERDNQICFEPQLNFARTIGLAFQLESKSLKNTLNDGLKLITKGTGTLFLKGHGTIVCQNIDTLEPIYVDENALIAYETTLNLRTISKGVKQLLLSGEGFIYAITCKGRLWIQTREEAVTSGSGGFIDGILNIVK